MSIVLILPDFARHVSLHETARPRKRRMLDCLFRRNTHFDLAPSMIGVACISLSDFTILSTDVLYFLK